MFKIITSIGIGRKLLMIITDIYGQYIRRLSKKMILYGVYSNTVSFTLRHFKKNIFIFILFECYINVCIH